MRRLKFIVLFLILTLISLGFKAPQNISANVPAGFFEVGTDFQIGGRWVRFINSANDMSKLSSSVNSNAIFIFTNNIDMRDRSFTPQSNFSGNIYGFGHTISNLRFTGSSLIANSSSGVIEWLNFENIEMGNNTNVSNSLLVGTNTGTIRNVAYSLRNTSDVLVIVPPMVNNNNNGLIQNIIGRYDINLDHQQFNAQNFQFNGIVRTSNNRITNTWLKGDINITRAGFFTYLPMPSSIANNSNDRCSDTINVNVITHGTISVNLNNCFYSSSEREFNLAETAFNQNYNASRLLENETAFNNLYQPASNPVFSRDFWRINEDQLIIAQNGRLGIAGRHPIEIRNHFNSLTTVNLYRTPFFNSQLLPLAFFSESANPPTRPFNEEINYSTNYSRVIINGNPVGRGGVIRELGEINISLESDHGLPTLRARLQINPTTNLSQANVQPVGFIPTTSIGVIVDQNNWSWNETPILTEGDYRFRIFSGSSESTEYAIRINPIISGISNNASYTNEVTPLITAASILINDEVFNNDRSFSKIGHYDVVFPNLTPANIRFTIEPNINLTNDENMTSPRPIRIPRNLEKLFINNLEVNEEFLETYGEYVTELENEYVFNPSFGNHRIRIEGLNGFTRNYDFAVTPRFNITTNSSNQKTVEAVGGLLLVDNVLITAGTIQLRNVGNYQLRFQLPDDQFALNAGEVIIEQQETVIPDIRTPLFGPYTGSVRPDIRGQGMTFTLNNRPITQEQVNQLQDVPGVYDLLISGKDGYSNRLRFEVTLEHNLNEDVYYDEVNLVLSSPNNTILFDDKETLFDYSSEVIKIGTYRVFTRNINGDQIPVKTFEIAPYNYNASVNNFILTININELHPHVVFFINDELISSARQNIRYDKAGRYDYRFESSPRVSEDDFIVYTSESLIIEPRFNRPILPVTNVVESYRVLNEVQKFTLNGRTFDGSRFNENTEFFINQNGLNEIVFEGVNGEIFTYNSIFENPHYQNTLSLLWPAIALGLFSAISIAMRFLGVYRNES